ncbi:group-specific protein [Fictibacillus nanhaiensis]|uniref:group-specific protein n=1 Tax=Fictibacillus nanhaiensis TaxID=742169 RepID=UPI001C961B21|nr:group-specific protein [Fictibacillus nanhaiensis]MBY6035868.1 group-specific protein [Fictibacillus nanhaiensis]
MKFYMASGFQNKELVKEMSLRIEETLGWKLTYDWTQNSRAQTVEDLADIGAKEFKAVMESNVVIVILPGGKGCHTELGIALGNQKHVFLYDPNRILNQLSEATTFYFLPEVKHWNGKLDELKTLL